jgi:hypothetical protein
MARLRFNRLLSQFLEGIISLFVARAVARITFGQICRYHRLLRRSSRRADLPRLSIAES